MVLMKEVAGNATAGHRHHLFDPEVVLLLTKVAKGNEFLQRTQFSGDHPPAATPAPLHHQPQQLLPYIAVRSLRQIHK